MKKLLVGFDGSGPATEAARMSGLLAKSLDAKVTVLAVGQLAPLVVAPTGMVVRVAEDKDFLPVAEEGARVAEAAGAKAEARVDLGDPGERIVAMATREGYDMAVVGHRGMGQVAGLVLGSVAKSVAEQAPCPVLVVKERAPESVKRILVATDGSAHARRAVETAAELARANGAEVSLLYVLDPKVLGALSTGKAKQELRRTLEQSGQEALDDAVRICERRGAASKTVLAVGRPAAVILKRARFREYDLVATGRRGLGGMARLLVGSVSDEVLMGAECPVLLVGERAKR